MKWFLMISEVEVGRNHLLLDMRQQTEKSSNRKSLHRYYRKFGIISKFRKTQASILAEQRNQREAILLNRFCPKAMHYACVF